MLHKAQINYHPEKDDKGDRRETLTFSKEKDARDFVARMRKMDSVQSAKYYQDKK